MTPASTLRSLLAGAIDYAGLFPPARLSMREAVERYGTYAEGPEAWALGRFVVPAARLDELAAERGATTTATRVWRLSAILGSDVIADCAAIRQFNAANSANASVDSVEFRVGGIQPPREQIAAVVRAVPTATRVFAELSLEEEVSELIRSVFAEHVCAKVRTGGVTADAFPSPQDLAAFIVACAEAGVAFKATAGLHHPCRGSYPLTYDDGAPTGTMFGFLNVLVAAVGAQQGLEERDIVAILGVEQGCRFCFDDDGLTWRGVRVSRAHVEESRRNFALSFGSCSFEEPIDDLRRLSLL